MKYVRKGEYNVLHSSYVKPGSRLVTIVHWKIKQPFSNGKYQWYEDSSWNVMAHGDAQEGSEGETGEWSG